VVSDADCQLVARVVAAIAEGADAQGAARGAVLAACWTPGPLRPVRAGVAAPLALEAGPLAAAGLLRRDRALSRL
jgi:hypothetical protein